MKADPKKIFDYLNSKFGSELEEKIQKELNTQECEVINILIDSYRNKTVEPTSHSDDNIFMEYITKLCKETNESCQQTNS